MTNLIVVFPKAENGKAVRSILMRNGYEVHAVCTSGAQAIRIAEELGYGIIVCGYRLTDMLYVDVAKSLPEGFEFVVLGSKERLAECSGRGYRFLAMPLKAFELTEMIATLEMSVSRRRKRLRQMPKKRDDKQAEQIRAAKALLMERKGMTEDEAHRYLQKTSMDSGTSMAETAEKILRLI